MDSEIDIFNKEIFGDEASDSTSTSNGDSGLGILLMAGLLILEISPENGMVGLLTFLWTGLLSSSWAQDIIIILQTISFLHLYLFLHMVGL